MKKILILGAGSGMARPLMQKLFGPQVQMFLAGRHPQELEKTAADLSLRGHGPQPLVFQLDALKLETHEKLFRQILLKAKALDEVYLFFGQMHPQLEAQKKFPLAQEMIITNYLGAVSLLEQVAAHMESRHQGIIVAVGSVAGDRGRQSNYFYGSAKAGLGVYLQGLRNRLAHAGVQVVTIKPGFVDTAMTRGMKKGLLFAKPETIAKGILKAVRKRKNVVYLPWFWRWIMLAICMIPENIFKKMRL